MADSLPRAAATEWRITSRTSKWRRSQPAHDEILPAAAEEQSVVAGDMSSSMPRAAAEAASMRG
jgi:hypothetical protein